MKDHEKKAETAYKRMWRRGITTKKQNEWEKIEEKERAEYDRWMKASNSAQNEAAIREYERTLFDPAAEEKYRVRCGILALRMSGMYPAWYWDIFAGLNNVIFNEKT